MSEKPDFLQDVEEEEDDDSVVEVEAEEVDDDTGVTSDPPVADFDNSLVRPVADVQEVSDVYDQFEVIKRNLLTDDDTQSIGGGGNKRTFITKSGWRKIATAFNVSVDVVEKEKEVSEDGVVTWRVKARATAPNGKIAESWAVCASNESNHMEYIGKNKNDVESHKVHDIDDPRVVKVEGKWRRLKEPREVNEHDILATSETRAKNRAISDLVGGGSVSAEEVSKDSVLE